MPPCDPARELRLWSLRERLKGLIDFRVFQGGRNSVLLRDLAEAVLEVVREPGRSEDVTAHPL